MKLSKLILEKAKILPELESLGHPSEADDGWDEAYFDEVGLMDWINKVEELKYEIRNARRGVTTNADNIHGIYGYLADLENELGNILEQIR